MGDSKKFNEQLAAFDNSEVMMNYLKIAYDSGILNLEEQDIPKLEPADGNASEEKYNVSPSEDKTGRELIEMAHPEKAETVDSYLDGGGVVENEQEAQDVDVQVAEKMPTLNDRSHREIAVATTDLMNELILIADEMDLREHENLSKFADTMVAGINKSMTPVKKKLNKQAGIGKILTNKTVIKFLLSAAGIGAVSAIGARYLPPKKEMPVNALIDIMNSSLDDFINGKIEVPALQSQINAAKTFKQNLEKYKLDYDEKTKLLKNIFKELETAIDINMDEKEIDKLLEEYKSANANLSKTLSAIKSIITESTSEKLNINKILETIASMKEENSSNLLDYMEWIYNFVASSKKEEVKSILERLDLETDKEIKMLDESKKLTEMMISQYKEKSSVGDVGKKTEEPEEEPEE